MNNIEIKKYMIEGAYSLSIQKDLIYFSFSNKSDIFFYICLTYEISLYDGLNLSCAIKTQE